MISTIEFTTVKPVVRPLSVGRPVTVSGLLGAGSAFAGLSGLSGNLPVFALCGVQAGALVAADGVEGGMGRATQAPVAGSAWIEESVSVADGAGHRAGQQHPAGTTGVTKHYPSKKRAFRGLEPWRDPA